MKKEKKDVIILGSGGLAREFANYFSEYINIIGFLTKNPEDFKKYNLTGDLFSSLITIENSPSKNLVIAIGSPKVKKSLYFEFKKKGFSFPTFKHPSSIISESASLGEGVIISPCSIIGPNVDIGNCVYINYQVGVGHDSNIGSYTQINPGAQIGGSTFIKGDTLVGSNATIFQNTIIEKNITIGSGAIVLGKKMKAGTISPSFSKYLPF